MGKHGPTSTEKIVPAEILELLEEAIGYEYAIAFCRFRDGEYWLTVSAEGMEVSTIIDKPFSEDPPLAATICRQLVHQVHSKTSEPSIEKIKEFVYED